MLVLPRRAYNILMQPLSHARGDRWCFGGFAVLAMHGSHCHQFSLVTGTTESEKLNYGLKFGQEEETYNTWRPTVFRPPDLPVRLLQQHRTCTSCSPPGRGGDSGFHVPGRQHVAFNLNGFQLQPVGAQIPQGRVLKHLADVLNRAQPRFRS